VLRLHQDNTGQDPQTRGDKVSMDYHRIKNWPIDKTTQRYDNRDTILYAIGVGTAMENPLPAADLQFVYEHKLQALPTFAAILGANSAWLADPATGIDLSQVLHGEQFLRIERPLPAAGEVQAVERVEEIYDKGAGKGAVMYLSRELYDTSDGQLLAVSGYSIFMRGNGGFGGSASGQPQPHPMPQGRDPDDAIDLPTRAEQAAIYRLSGDRNPLHIDPEAARQARFDRPILHGMCSYGLAGRAVLKLRCDSDAARLRRLDARFANPVFPGETLRTEIWDTAPGEIAFRVKVVERDVVALNNGYAQFHI
jgi:acyl dehydratase